MKKLLLILLLLMATINSYAYDFWAVCSTGQTLYYNITSDSTVYVTYPSYYNYGTTSSYYHGRTMPGGSIVIPDTVTHGGVVYRVTAIGPYAFYECTGIDSIFFNNHIVSIGASAFYGCAGLHHVVIPDGIHAIQPNTFMGCTNINELHIGSGVDTIYGYAFAGCPSIHRLIIPDNVSCIGSWAFSGCSGIDSLYIGGNVRIIGERAFAFSGLEYMYYNAKNVQLLYQYSLPACDFLFVGDSVDTIPAYAFYNKVIDTIIISDSVIHIGDYAFCIRGTIDYAINYLNIGSNVKSIGQGAFYNAFRNIQHLIIPDSVILIGDSAFYNCQNVQTINIGNNVRTIGGNAFYNCQNVQNINIGDNVRIIGNYAFYNCTNVHQLNIPDRVTNIGTYAFYGCSSVDSIYFGVNLSTIGRSAFEGCSNLKWMHYNARNLQRPLFDVWGCNRNGCGWNWGNTYGSDVPFLGMNPANFEYLIIGDSVVYVPDGCFNRVSSLDTLVFNAKNCYQLDARSVFYGSNFHSGIIGDSVRRLPDYVFDKLPRPYFDSIPWRDSLRYIGMNCFAGYNTITGTLNIPASVDSIVGAFSSCGNITSLTTNARYIGEGAFSNCDNILLLNTNVQTIGTNAFANCDRLVSVTLGDSVQTLGSGAFNGCFRLNNVTLGEGITSIGDSAFGGCIRLIKPELPNSLATIGARAFDGCGDINGKLTFPATITHIGDSAYNGVGNITEIEMKGSTPPTIHAHTFAAVDSLVTVGVPCGAVMNYYITDYWENFPNIVEASPYRLTVGSNNEVMGTATVTQQTTCSNHTASIYATAQTGYHFLQWNDGITANPRSIPMTQDSTFTAIFVVNNSYITVHANDSTMGSVSGTGLYGYNAPVTLTATAYSGYHFLRWSDGNTQNPRYLAAIRDSSFTAIFVSNVSTITVANANPDMGNVGGSGVYYYQNLVSITATANYGYHFVQWNDGNTQNPRTIIVSQDSAFTAYFALNTYSIVATSNSTTMGSVSGGGQYTYLHEMSMTATPAYGYHFVQWNDGVTDNPRTLTVTRDSAFIAQFAANSYTLTVAANDATMGSAYGAGSYNYNTTATLSAVANYGYHFTQWSDAVTDNPRIVTVLNNATYTAQFAINSYTLTVQSSNPAIGTTSGGGSYNYLTPVTITALPNVGYHFVQWSDGNTTNPRLVSVTANATYTAQFAINSYAVGVTSNNSTMGYVSGSGTYNHNSTATLTATAYYGYHFVQWQDGNTLNPRTVVVTDSAQYTAQFDYNSYLITTLSNNISRGSTMGSGSYNFLSQAEITAVPMPHYHFTQWSDGVIDNPRTITVTQDSTFTAYFDINQFSLILDVNDASLGYVSGSGIYNDMSQVTISATAAQHCHFVQWSDGNTSNPRLITLTSDTTFIAQFEEDARYSITVSSNDTTMGTVSGSGIYYGGEQVLLTASPCEHYHFVQWGDGNTQNPRTITVVGDADYTAVFEADIFTISVSANDPAMGSVMGGGEYGYGTEVTIAAQPFAGYGFRGWNDGDTNRERTIVVTEDANYQAIFYDMVGISDVEILDYSVNVKQNNIHIAGVSQRKIAVYDITGRRIAYIDKSPETFLVTVPATGVYLIQVEGMRARKVVVY